MFYGVRVALFVVFCVLLCWQLFDFLSLFFWRLYCLSFCELRLMILPLVLCCRSLFDFLSLFFWRLYCLSFCELRLMILPLVLCCRSLFVLVVPFLLTIVLSVLLRFTAYDYFFGIFFIKYGRVWIIFKIISTQSVFTSAHRHISGADQGGWGRTRCVPPKIGKKYDFIA